MAAGSDAELMLRVKAGDADSFGDLLARHRSPVVNYLYRMVHNAAVAEELAQEVFLRVYRARGNYEPSAKFTTWLYRIATNVALNHIRDGRLGKPMAALDDPESEAGRELRTSDPNAEERLVAQSLGWEVRQAVLALPEKQRIAVLLHKYQELDYKQIAGVLGCSESAVKSLLFRAYEALRERLSHLAGGRS
ncbi:MAG TPA: sigma-70 family RNA polymerase sigma factor [Terriglobia bacterium]|nr:sigma-70 family RNA polymerase sigma factor [Terriglobia bacterium]